ncbi:vomeronasal type-2 receptor 26-like [Latimeria chalumnae]|uniref:vomeronasal type-2 receptor 26-like n=1 Tax=Latimeria chalumnae TaxID=7897 RepID=UPI00313CE16B
MDLGARGRRKNIRIFGVPEGEESVAINMECYVKNLLKQLIPSLKEEELDIEHTHQTLQNSPREGQMPKAIVEKLQNFKAKEFILREVRGTRTFELKSGKMIQIHQDLLKELLDKRKKFDNVCEQCREKGLGLDLCYPTIFLITKNDSTECLKCPYDQWSIEQQDKCIPKAVEFLAYTDAMGVILAALSIFCAFLSLTLLCIFIKYKSTPIVKANNRELSYLLLLALVLCFLSSLAFFGQPKTWSCMLRQAAFGIIFALSVSCVLAKTIMVVIAFNVTKPNSNLKKWVGPKLANSIVLVCTLIQIIICIVWLASAPPSAKENIKSQIGMIIIECNEGSTTAFWCVLGYMGLLAIVSFIVAFLARSLPDSFNEAKFITFSMLVFVSVWLPFIPAYLSTRGKYMVAVEIFAILASSAGLLACIFPLSVISSY